MLNKTYVVFDLETVCTGPDDKELLEIGAVKLKNEKITDSFEQLINPGYSIPQIIRELTGITDEMVKDMPTSRTVLKDFKKFCGNSVLVGHDVTYDLKFLNTVAKKHRMKFGNKTCDTLKMAQELYPDETKHNLGITCERLGVSNDHPHRALDDAKATAECFLKMSKMKKPKQPKQAKSANKTKRPKTAG